MSALPALAHVPGTVRTGEGRHIAPDTRVRFPTIRVPAALTTSPARINDNFAHVATVLLAFCSTPILEFGNGAMFFLVFAIMACTGAIITTIESGKSITFEGDGATCRQFGHGKLRRQSSALLIRR